MSRPRVPQPPINPRLRNAEEHGFWPAFAVALVAAALLFCGARHVTGLETVDGDSATEPQLVKAFTRGGLVFQEPRLFPDADASTGPPPSAADIREAERRAALPLRDRYRVNTGAVDPCPT